LHKKMPERCAIRPGKESCMSISGVLAAEEQISFERTDAMSPKRGMIAAWGSSYGYPMGHRVIRR
jgi:hypothetical protein